MKILNLTNLEKSDIKYKISKFPDGQQNITLNLMFTSGVKLVTIDSKINDLFAEDFPTWEEGIEIKSHLNNWLDLELIVCTVACLRELSLTNIHLNVPYFLGARSDRMFERGGNYYLRSVICPIINSLNLKSVSVLDPHSFVLANCIKNFRSDTNEDLVTWAIADIYHGWVHKQDTGWVFNLVSPDAGASHKIYKLAQEINYNGDIITCSKERDTEGKLTKTVVPIHDDGNTNKDFIIIDDICDGGRTFINIAAKIKEYYNHEDFDGYQPKIYLIVTHGIFSAGFEELGKYFDGIYCTNSVKDISFPWIVNGYLNRSSKQLNVF